ncbi:MAG: hypothetical protein U9O98_08580 [Asgard group archaeon]|nr:hypothetical protein [Asgard group archaeon]
MPKKDEKKSTEKQNQEKSEEDKQERKSLIATLRRSISIKGFSKKEPPRDPMNLLVTLSPTKHLDIIEYIEDNIPSGGRAEWVRDSIRLKMRIESGVYGLNTGEQDSSSLKDTEEMMSSVFGQFADVMTQIMNDMKETRGGRAPARVQPERREKRPERSSGGPPTIKKIEGEQPEKEIKPDRPSLDDAIGAIVVVE